MVLLNAGSALPASHPNMDGSNGAKQADSWHKHEPFMMVEKQKNKGKGVYIRSDFYATCKYGFCRFTFCFLSIVTRVSFVVSLRIQCFEIEFKRNLYATHVLINRIELPCPGQYNLYYLFNLLVVIIILHYIVLCCFVHYHICPSTWKL